MNFLFGLYQLKIRIYIVDIMFRKTKFSVESKGTDMFTQKCNKLVRENEFTLEETSYKQTRILVSIFFKCKMSVCHKLVKTIDITFGHSILKTVMHMAGKKLIFSFHL